jgi:hypothetical protein
MYDNCDPVTCFPPAGSGKRDLHILIDVFIHCLWHPFNLTQRMCNHETVKYWAGGHFAENIFDETNWVEFQQNL